VDGEQCDGPSVEEQSMHGNQARPRIYLTTHDYERLSALADVYKSRRSGALVDFLMAELERAELVPAAEVGRKVVTMNTRARIEDPGTGDSRTVTLVFPGEEDSMRGKVSVLTPLGYRAARLARRRAHGMADPRWPNEERRGHRGPIPAGNSRPPLAPRPPSSEPREIRALRHGLPSSRLV
jgi:regulator of nucleoside diphosphate kinase